MQLWRRPSLRRFASRIMLLAALAFVHQGALSAVSQAAAAIGVMPEAAVTMSGTLHYHGEVVRHVHTHDGDQVGHVHDTTDVDLDDASKPSAQPVCTLGLASCVMPAAVSAPLLFQNASRIAPSPCDPLTGIDPQRLNRPPSTPSIA